jgi:CheY-like chemotaxis protein
MQTLASAGLERQHLNTGANSRSKRGIFALTRILVAEDDAVFRELLLALLQQAGYEVTIATDGAAALAEAETSRFDALIADIVMPNMDGLELIRVLRSHAQDLPVIAISATEGDAPGQDYLPVAAVFGADATIGKRRIRDIMPVLHRLLGNRGEGAAAS